MVIIKKLSQQIENEIDESEKMIKLAVQYKEQFPEASQAFYSLSLEKLNNIKSLHDAVEKIIKDYRAEKGDPPAPMMAIYNYLHERHIDKVANIKSFQTLYKEGNI